MCTEVFLTGMKTKRDEGCRRMLLGNNTGGGAAMLQPIRFQHVEEWISTGPPCTYI